MEPTSAFSRALTLASPLDTLKDWVATGAATSGVLASMVVFDVVQRVAWRVSPHAQQEAARLMACSINRSARLSGATISVRGLENVDFKKNYIVVLNHQSMFDISLLTEFLGPLHPRYVSKREIARGVPGVSYNLRRGASALIDRKKPSEARAIIADITRRIRDENLTVAIFPEGTRSRTGQMKPFRPGGLLELVQGAPNTMVLPVTSYGGSELFSKSLRPLVRNVDLGMVFHPPVASPQTDDGSAFTDFVKSLESTIATGLPA